eukprot:7838751-Alexandrium_andersonii.AAC.1
MPRAHPCFFVDAARGRQTPANTQQGTRGPQQATPATKPLRNRHQPKQRKEGQTSPKGDPRSKCLVQACHSSRP